ncbi:MAG TPA: manganese efflux pump [Candidatus Binatia bacterium]|nr:manganese efflux pump [Candidatus Binatia bacterium]
MTDVLALILAGLSVGLGNFAASIAIGLSGVSKDVRLKTALVFGIFETGMPIVGLVLGKQAASHLGSHASQIGGSLLILTGMYIVYEALTKVTEKEVGIAESTGMAKLLLAGLALSIDNLIVGFSLGAHHQSILEAAIIIGVTSVALALLGLEIGSRASAKLEEYSELASGIILIIVGLAIGFKVLG